MVLSHVLTCHFYLSILLLTNPTFHQRKLKIFWHITSGSRGESFSGIVTGLLGVPRHNLTKCYKTALQNGPPTTDHESCSLHIKTCCFPFLISHMLLSIRCHLSFVLINISLITIDIEHFFKRVKFLSFLVCEIVYTFCSFCYEFYVFFLGISSFLFYCRYEFLAGFRCFKHLCPICELRLLYPSFSRNPSFWYCHISLSLFFSFLIFGFLFFSLIWKIIFVNP